ncbi:MAG: hypothetical protein Q8K12_14400 [Thiobacillus sp.]|nr:hypothetical protein [Thiobacillus sp.]
MNAEHQAPQEISLIKARIAEVYARRERLKQALETGALAPRAGFIQLNETDRLLSDLDTRFKTLWDATRPAHPATQWAHDTPLEPAHLDCVTAIMLKILDGKCKMGEAEKSALTAVYDVVKVQPGQSLGDAVHALIAQARQGADHALAEAIHAWRVRAETQIPKPVMKGFKQLLRTSLPMPGPAPQEEPTP